MTVVVALVVIGLIVLAHWFLSRTRFHPLALVVPIAWFIGSLAYMIHEHSLDTHGIAACLGGTAFLFGMWGSGVDHHRKRHGQVDGSD